MDGKSQKLGLSDLLDQDITSYEYFQSLSKDIQNEIKTRDIGSFNDMKNFVSNFKSFY